MAQFLIEHIAEKPMRNNLKVRIELKEADPDNGLWKARLTRQGLTAWLYQINLIGRYVGTIE